MSDKDYRYVCEDKSILLPYLKGWLWGPISARIPEQISANSLSLSGSFCAVLAFISSMLIPPERSVLYVIPSALIFAYLTLDNIDGAHARKTNQSSPLGEFIDHWLDTFNNGFLIWGLAIVLQIPLWEILLLQGAVGLAFFGALWEQRHTGVMRMEALGNIEGLVLASGLYLLLAIFGVEGLSNRRLLGLLTFTEACAIFTLANAVFTSARCFWRTKVARAQWLPLLVTVSASLAWFTLGAPSHLAVASILLFANPALTGRHVVRRVLGRALSQRPHDLFVWGFPALVALTLALDLPSAAQTGLAWLCAALLMAQSVYSFGAAIHALRAHLRPQELLGRLFLRRAPRGSAR